MESESRMHWCLIPVSNLLINSLLALFLLISSVSCQTKSREVIRYEKVIDSISAGLQKQYIDFQSIDEKKIRTLQSEIELYLQDSSFARNENASSALRSARKFLAGFEKEKSVCKLELEQNIKQLKDLRENASDLTISSDNNIQWLNNNGLEEVVNKADYLLNRFHAQVMLAETFRKAKTNAAKKQ